MKYAAGWIVAAAMAMLALSQGRQTAGPMQPTVVGVAAEQLIGINDQGLATWRVIRVWEHEVSAKSALTMTAESVASELR